MSLRDSKGCGRSGSFLFFLHCHQSPEGGGNSEYFLPFMHAGGLGS